MKDKKKNEYAAFRSKIMRRFCANAVVSVLVVIFFYQYFWKQRVGDWVVRLLESVMHIDHEGAFFIYHTYIRGYREIFFAAAVILIFLFLLWRLFRWMDKYFREINDGIDILLHDDSAKIRLSKEMFPFERKLNVAKKTLEKRKADVALAERRKDELVMYLAHDIRTPLTSVIGYLNLMNDEPEMPTIQRAKYMHITLDKAYHLEEMINEFFEITRYNSLQIILSKTSIDLYYMLLQLSDQLSPVFSPRGNSVVLNMDENLIIYGDADKLARVFGNILKNAATYSYPKTEIFITAEETDTHITLRFQNQGKTIPAEELTQLFDKFYRSDKARGSNTGGTGLGLAIAKEIILLHGGTISATSENETIVFIVGLPKAD